MNGFIVLDPVGIPQKNSRNVMQRVENLEGKRIGFIWGMHELSTKFWPVLEEEAVAAFKPAKFTASTRMIRPTEERRGIPGSRRRSL